MKVHHAIKPEKSVKKSKTEEKYLQIKENNKKKKFKKRCKAYEVLTLIYTFLKCLFLPSLVTVSDLSSAVGKQIGSSTLGTNTMSRSSFTKAISYVS